MRRFRLSTLMLLVAIAALSIGLFIQEMRHCGREATLHARIAEANEAVAEHYALGIMHSGDDKVITKPHK